MSFESQVFIDMVNAARQNESDLRTFDAVVRRYLDAVIDSNETGYDIEKLIETDRSAAAGCGFYDMEVYDRTVATCRHAEEIVSLGSYAMDTMHSYSRSNKLDWDIKSGTAAGINVVTFRPKASGE